MITLLLAGLLAPAASAPAPPAAPLCNELCIYYTHRSAPLVRDEGGRVRQGYKPYIDCIIGLAGGFDWASIVDEADAGRFVDLAWTRCAAERAAGDRVATAQAAAQPGLDRSQVAAAVAASRAMQVVVLAALLFHKAARGPQMSAYVKAVRARLAPELDGK